MNESDRSDSTALAIVTSELKNRNAASNDRVGISALSEISTDVSAVASVSKLAITSITGAQQRYVDMLDSFIEIEPPGTTSKFKSASGPTIDVDPKTTSDSPLATSDRKETKSLLQSIVEAIKKSSDDLLEYFKNRSLLDEENRRELMSALDGAKNLRIGGDATTKDSMSKPSSIIQAIVEFVSGMSKVAVVTGALGLAIGGAIGYFGYLMESLSGVVSLFTKLASPLTKVISALGKFSMSAFAEVADVASPITRGIGRAASAVSKGVGASGKVSQAVAEAKYLSNLLMESTGVGRLITNVITSGKAMFNTFTKTFSKFFTIGKSIGKFLGPVITIFDGVMGFVDGWKKTVGLDFITRIKEGIYGMVKGVFGGIAGIGDMVKSVVSTVAGWFGLDSVEKFLDSFSIKDIVSGMIDSVLRSFESIGERIGSAVWSVWEVFFGEKGTFFTRVFDAFKSFQDLALTVLMSPINAIISALDSFSGALGFSPKDMVNDFIRNILKSILPDPNGPEPWYSPSKLVAAAIPTSVYEYAGEQKKPADVSPKGADTQTPTISAPDTSAPLSDRIFGNIQNKPAELASPDSRRGEAMIALKKDTETTKAVISSSGGAGAVVAPSSTTNNSPRNSVVNNVSYSQSNMPDRMTGMLPGGAYAF